AIAHFEVAAALAAPERHAVIDHRLGLVHARRGAGDRAAAHRDVAFAPVPDVEAGTRSALLADRSAIAHRAGDRAAARRHADEALRLATAVADASGVARAEDLLVILVRGAGDLSTALEHLERARTAAAAS